jgi:catecholate siderophore receptor
VWTTYNCHHGIKVGYGLNYTSWVYATANDASTTAIYNRVTIPGFVVHNLMASYNLNERFNLQLNVRNLFDKEYFTQLRSTSTTSGWVNPGTGRTATLAANINF